MAVKLSVSDAEALEARCPKCKARKGKPCTYLTEGRKYDRQWIEGLHQWRYTRHTIYRVGDPCKGVHNERREKVRRARYAAAYDAAARPAPSALQSLLAFDQTEYTKTKEWLRNYAAVLWS